LVAQLQSRLAHSFKGTFTIQQQQNESRQGFGKGIRMKVFVLELFLPKKVKTFDWNLFVFITNDKKWCQADSGQSN